LPVKDSERRIAHRLVTFSADVVSVNAEPVGQCDSKLACVEHIVTSWCDET
jgi:hypothetical protein